MINTLQIKSFSEIENEINEILKTPGLGDIIEVTYGYSIPEHNSEVSYNTTLFTDFLKVSYEDFFIRGSSFVALKTAFLSKSNSIIQRLLGIIDELNICTEVDLLKKELIVNAIKYNINTIKLAQNGIDFELEKAGMKLALSEEQIGEKLELNKALEKELFGGDILDSEEESVGSLKFIEKRLLLEGNKLSEEEKLKMTSLIDTLKNALEKKGYNYISPTLDFISRKEGKNSFFQKFGDIKIPRDSYVHIFQEVIDVSGLHQKVIVNPNKGSIYDGPNALEIPANDKFKELSIERVMKLIAHEILGHYYNQRNHEKFFGNIRGSGNVEKEEGLAKFLEYTLLGKEVGDDEMYEAPFSQLFACEILSGDEFKAFLSIFTKIAEAKSTNEELFRRRKRNYSMHHAGAQHKDTTYTRGLKKIIDFVKKGGDIKLLFNGKFGLDDLISKKVDFSSEDDFLLPIFVPDIIIFYILIEKGLLQTEFTHDNFIIFLQDKYKESLPGIDFNSIKMVTFFQKRKILMIINNFRDLLKEEVSE